MGTEEVNLDPRNWPLNGNEGTKPARGNLRVKGELCFC